MEKNSEPSDVAGRGRIDKLIKVLEPAGRYAAGCPWNETNEGLRECLYSLAGDSREIKRAVDERLESRSRELREQAEVGLVEGKSYSKDPRWYIELRSMAREYERGVFDDSDEGAVLRGVLAEACACYGSGDCLIVPEGLMRKYVQLTFDSWREL